MDRQTVNVIFVTKKSGLNYRCMWDWRGQDDQRLVLKCGKCGRGNMLPKKGFKCRVCGAAVSEIHKPEFRSNR